MTTRERVRDLTLIFFCVFSKKIHPGKLHFTFFSPEKLVQLFILKEVQRYLDSKMIKLLTFDNLFPPLRHSRYNPF